LIKFGVYRQDENYKKFLEFLPDIVASELGYIIYKPLVKGIGFFENAKKEFISTIVPELKTCMFAKNEVVFREGESSKEMYFIKKGKVSHMLAEFPDYPFMSLGKGNYFGEIDMIFVQKRKFTAIASTELELLALDSDKYKDLIMNTFSTFAATLREKAIKRRIKQADLYEEALEEATRIQNLKKHHWDHRRRGIIETQQIRDLINKVLFR